MCLSLLFWEIVYNLNGKGLDRFNDCINCTNFLRFYSIVMLIIDVINGHDTWFCKLIPISIAFFCSCAKVSSTFWFICIIGSTWVVFVVRKAENCPKNENKHVCLLWLQFLMHVLLWVRQVCGCNEAWKFGLALYKMVLKVGTCNLLRFMLQLLFVAVLVTTAI